MLLDIRDVTILYGKVAAVNNISLQVIEGDIVTLLGANGAGKTTTLKAISGLKKLASGEIWFSEHRIDKMPPWQIRKPGASGFGSVGRVARPSTARRFCGLDCPFSLRAATGTGPGPGLFGRALAADSFEEFGGGFIGAAFGPRQLRFRGYQFPAKGSGEDGLSQLVSAPRGSG